MDFDRFFSLFFCCGACFYGVVLKQAEKDKRWQIANKKRLGGKIFLWDEHL